jgi:hypothetical protein
MTTPPTIFPAADGQFVVQCGACLRNSPPMAASSIASAWEEAQRVGWMLHQTFARCPDCTKAYDALAETRRVLPKRR